MLNKDKELTVLMPCLNEAMTVENCIKQAQSAIEELGIDGEVLIADNGSTDNSQQIAEAAGARVVSVKEKGYGAALLGGINNARGKYIIMGDADESYDFSQLKDYIEKLREGYDLVMGNRFQGGIKPGAMPNLHRYLGNPVLSFIGKLFFRVPISDFHCGLRGFSAEAAHKMNLQTSGMEFASEMVVKASLLDLKICEVPTTLSPDGRDRPPHLRSWRDGWRHLRFLLIFSPRWLFLYPGIVLMLFGIIASMYLLQLNRTNSLLLSLVLLIIGFQSTCFSLIIRAFATNINIMPRSEILTRFFKYFSLERGLIVSGGIFGTGVLGVIYAIYHWMLRDFSTFPAEITRTVVVPASFLLILSVMMFFNSFVLSILSLEHVDANQRQIEKSK